MNYKVVEMNLCAEEKMAAVGIIHMSDDNGFRARLSYKIMNTKTGGHFPVSPSVKITKDGSDFYISGFTPDSQIDSENIKSILLQAYHAASKAPKKSFDSSSQSSSSFFEDTLKQPLNAKIEDEVPF